MHLSEATAADRTCSPWLLLLLLLLLLLSELYCWIWLASAVMLPSPHMFFIAEAKLATSRLCCTMSSIFPRSKGWHRACVLQVARLISMFFSRTAQLVGISCDKHSAAQCRERLLLGWYLARQQGH
jgi:hypothetical protein